MYSTLLIAHSWVRWAVLAAGVIALARALAGWKGQRAWTSTDDRAALFFTTALDLQMLIGLLLYFAVSPLLETIRQHLDEAMRDATMRYWLVEHPAGMVAGLVLAHIGRARIRKAAEPRRKHRLAVIFFGLALVAMAAALPWPGLATGRPLFRV